MVDEKESMDNEENMTVLNTEDPLEAEGANKIDLEGEWSIIEAAVEKAKNGYNVFEEVSLARDIYYLTIVWPEFQVVIEEPTLPPAYPPAILNPGPNEYLYPIFDYGNRLATSPGEQLMVSTRSTGRFLATIEKIMKMAIERAYREVGGNDEKNPPVYFSFLGHEIGFRKAFKECVLANKNIFINNFDPGDWGEAHLRAMDVLAEKGYLKGY